MSVKCPKCDTENPSDSKYCKECATPLPSSGEVSVTKTLETPVEGLKRGTTFAERYEIIEELGKGGMGEVFRVNDEKLNEEMALKVLKPEIAADKGIIERFKNELKLARKIAHKYVCKMYDLNEEEGIPYITMEYVEGEDLKSYIIKKNKLTQEEAISMAKQVCEGLAEAHELGVVHRDLKPQNIMIDKKGRAKIMDFGIARSVEAPGVTQTGVMIGTPNYMSPEQAEGEEADQRSDIYSLGVILYEMVTGSVPFKGETALSVALKHKSQFPSDPRKLNPDISENLSRLILICMEKAKEKRYRSAGEVYSALDKIEKGLPIDIAPTKMRSLFLFLKERKIVETLAAFIGGGWLILEVIHWILIDHYHFPEETLDIAIVTLLCALVCTLIWRFFGGIERRRRKVKIEYILIPVIILITAFFDLRLVQKISISEEGATREAITPSYKQLTFIGDASYPAISPDGKFIAYVTGPQGAEQRVMVQAIEGGQAIEISQGEWFINLQWLPDSSALSFYAFGTEYGSGIFMVPRLGGAHRKLLSVPHQNPPFTWSPEGSQIVYYDLFKKNFNITDMLTSKTTLISLNGTFPHLGGIDWSPDGNLLLFFTRDEIGRNAIWIIKIDGSKQSKIVEDDAWLGSPQWSPKGDAIYYSRQGELWKILFSPEEGGTTKPASLVLGGLQAGSFTITRDGRQMLYTRAISYSNLWQATVEGTGKNQVVKTKQFTRGSFYDRDVSISHDGSLVAFYRGDGKTSNIYVLPIEGGTPRQITFLDSNNAYPAWSPDGKEIAFGSNYGRSPKVWKVSAQGGTPYQFSKSRLNSGLGTITWAPGPNIIYQTSAEIDEFNILNPTTEEENPLVKDDEEDGQMMNARYSPDGKKVAVYWDQPSSEGLWIISPEDSSRVLLKEERLYPLEWTSDGKWIYALQELSGKIEIIMISLDGTQVKSLLAKPYFQEQDRFFELVFSMAITPDGNHFVYPISKSHSDVWLVDNFDKDLK